MQGVEDGWLRKRIERLEDLLELVRAIASTAAAAAALTSFAGPIVANQAAAVALNTTVMPNGEQVFTLDQRAIWTKINGAPGTIGVPPLSPDEVLATTDGTGVLARTTYSDPKWRIGVNDIYIDPANGAASNENDGLHRADAAENGL